MTPSWFHRELGNNAKGADVELVQRRLKCYTTGIYDKETAARVRAVQKRHGLEVTGRVDEATAIAIGESERHGVVPDWFKRTLRVGMMGDDVRALNRQLGLPTSDAFDDRTERAVRRYQSTLTMTPNGVVDRNLAIRLGDDVPLIQT